MYCTLDDAKRELSASKTNSTADDNELMQYVRLVSRRFDRMVAPNRNRPFFAPYQEARQFEIERTAVNSRRGAFVFDPPLLEFTAVTAGDSTITSSVVLDAAGRTPAYALRFSDSTRSWYRYLCDAVTYVTITGTWGFNTDWDNAWATVDAFAADALAADTQIEVTDADGGDQWGITPRFSRGTIIRGDDEYMYVTAVDTDNNLLTVRRGQFGTTSEFHADGVDIDVYQVEPPIKQAAARAAAFLYSRKGAFVTRQAQGMSEVIYPTDLPPDVVMTLQEYQYGY